MRKNQQAKFKIKKGDQVIVISGKDKGKQGPVLTVMPTEALVVVEGIGMVKRAHRASGGQSGRIVEKPRAIAISNVMLLDPKEKKGTRVKREMQGEKNVRVTVKSNTTLS